MKTLHLKPRVPQYMKSFQCLGGDCPESCCYGWQIGIDEQTYNKYQKVNIYPLATKLKASLQALENPKPAMVATIRLREEDGGCPLLTEKGLCSVHSQLGSPYLSDTCMHYPRSFNLVNSQASCYASMSCPAVADAGLRDPDSMTITEMDMSILGRSEVPVALAIDGKNNQSPVIEFLEPIYEVTCMILRQPELTATEAMIVISLMLQKLVRHFAEIDPDVARNGVVQTLTDFCRPAYCHEVKNAITQLPQQTHAKISLLKGVTIKFLHERSGRASFMDMLAQAAKGLHFEAADLSVSAESYLDAEKNWFAPFDDRHPHMLKNYLLNDLGKNCFPAGKTLNIEAEFISLAVRFALIKLYLVGIAGVKREAFGEQDYVRTVYTFVRNLEHSNFFAVTQAAMEEQGYNNLASAVLMLR